jgi:hypothetical protein
MSWLRKIALVSAIWLTAAMTVFAGVPHFVCACFPANQGRTSQARVIESCCCCCAKTSQAGETGKTRACCQHKKTQPNEYSGSQTKLRAPSCARTLVNFSVLALSPAKISVDQAVGSPMINAAESCDIGSTMHGTAKPSFHHVGNGAAPGDLIIVLQHILI